jgi:hypothetical protein
MSFEDHEQEGAGTDVCRLHEVLLNLNSVSFDLLFKSSLINVPYHPTLPT